MGIFLKSETVNNADPALALDSHGDSHLCEVDRNQEALLMIPMGIIWRTENRVEEERMGFSTSLNHSSVD